MLFSYCGKWTQLRRTRTDISVPFYHFLSFTTCSVFSLSYSHFGYITILLDISPYHLTIGYFEYITILSSSLSLWVCIQNCKKLCKNKILLRSSQLENATSWPCPENVENVIFLYRFYTKILHRFRIFQKATLSWVGCLLFHQKDLCQIWMK